MNRAGAILSLTRPVNAAICGLSVIAGGSLGGRPLDRLGELGVTLVTRGFWNLDLWQWRTILAALSASLILAAGNVFNDVRDVAADRINAPGRAIASGQVSTAAAALFAAVLALGGLCLSLPLGPGAIAIAIAAALILVWYDMRLKGVPLAGNIAVALLGGLAFVYGGIAGQGTAQSLVPALFAVLFHLGRELIKDGADYEGDRAAGIRTIATIRSPKSAALAAAVVLVSLSAATLAPAVTGQFGPAYLAIIVIAILPVIGWCAVSAVRQPTAANLKRLSILLKADMPAGIIAVLIGFQQM